jgi:hypothetical protein
LKLASEVGLHTDTVHDRVVRDIAEHRFGLDEWTVTTRPDTLAENAQLQVVPDILATHEGDVVAIGQVAAGDICEEQAKYWKALGDSCVRFYLYVPAEHVETACRMINEHEVACAGLRKYKYNGKLEIEPVYLDAPVDHSSDHPWWTRLGAGEDTIN